MAKATTTEPNPKPFAMSLAITIGEACAEMATASDKDHLGRAWIQIDYGQERPYLVGVIVAFGPAHVVLRPFHEGVGVTVQPVLVTLGGANQALNFGMPDWVAQMLEDLGEMPKPQKVQKSKAKKPKTAKRSTSSGKAK